MQTATAERIKPPSMLLALTEFQRALIELSTLPAAAPILSMAPKGDGHPVLVLPGFTASDRSTAILRRYLNELGYRTFTWDLGRNLGPRSIGRQGEHLLARLREIHEETGQTVSLVGWSLGGVMARQLARRMPKAVRQVISLGSPFTGDPRATNVWRVYEGVTGQRINDADVREQLRESELPPPVPSTAIYSRSDGIVAWKNCIEPEADTSESIEVYGSHCGLGVNPAVMFAVADRLAQPEGEWAPFDRGGWRAVFYPSPTR
jgi:pimeloyl-ACP methyl ester carboxylesterase